jgi:hypothetical protein
MGYSSRATDRQDNQHEELTMTSKRIARILSLMCFTVFTSTGYSTDAAPAIVSGYGETTWGQSLAEVQKIWPGGKAEVRGEMSTTYEVAAAADDRPVTKRIVHFVDNQLSGITVVYELPRRPAKGPDEEGVTHIEAIIAKKYHSTPEVTRELRKMYGIVIDARARRHGAVHVRYENIKGSEAAKKAYQARLAQEAAERRAKSTRTQELKALALEESL